MYHPKHRATKTVRGMAAEGDWRSAIPGAKMSMHGGASTNGPKPTIYPTTSGSHGLIHGFKSKEDKFGKWHHCPRD